jgi:8-oxo-dGTP diphosphatase
MSTTKVRFYDRETIDDTLLKFAVIAARYKNKWVYCKHKERNTWEIPGGHREKGEDILDTARRELKEETGAEQFTIDPVAVYSVTIDNETNYGKLFFSEMERVNEKLEYEIEKIALFDDMPPKLTYPEIQPLLQEYVQTKIKCK